MSKIGTIVLEDKVFQRMQDNLVNKVNQISENPFLSGIAVNNVLLVSGNNQVPHGLNKPYTGVIITRRGNASDIFDVASTDPRRFVGLNCSGTCLVNLWVY